MTILCPLTFLTCWFHQVDVVTSFPIAVAVDKKRRFSVDNLTIGVQQWRGALGAQAPPSLAEDQYR